MLANSQRISLIQLFSEEYVGAASPPARHITLSFYCSIIPHSSRGAFDLFTMYKSETTTSETWMKPPIERDLKINGTRLDKIEDKWQNAKRRSHERTGENAKDEDVEINGISRVLAFIVNTYGKTFEKWNNKRRE